MVDDDDSSILGLAIVGCGQIVTHHLEAIALLPNVVVRALCDPEQKRRQVIQDLLPTPAAGGESVAHFESLQDLIQDTSLLNTIQVIFIAVPHDLHESLALQALEQTECVVVMEKPLAPTRDACNGLVQASLKYGHNRLVIAEQSPYWQEVALAKTMIQAGAIGHVVSAAAYYYESMRDNVTSGSVDCATGGLGWRGSVKRAGGGIAMDGGLHWIRPLSEMCGGRIESVVGVIRTHLAPELQMEAESLGHALFKIASSPSTRSVIESEQEQPLSPLSQPAGSGPLIATYSCNMLAMAPMAHDACPYFRITGTKGELVIHGTGLFKEQPGAGGMRLYDQENPGGKELFAADRMGGFFLGFCGLWQHIYQMVVEQDVSAAHETVVRAADDVRVVLALYKSSETGQWETV